MSFYKFLKMAMFVVNFIIFLGGGAILGVGIWIKVDGGSFFVVLEKVSASLKVVVNIGYLCIALGALLMIIGFLGCCGAMKENKCMLMIFFLIILVIFLAQLVAAVVILAFSGLADIFMSYIGTWLKDFFKNDYGRNHEITEIFDAVMTQFKCCGLNGHIDFANSHFTNTTSTYPGACCNGPFACMTPASVQGCYQLFLKFLKSNTIILGVVALVIAVLEGVTIWEPDLIVIQGVNSNGKLSRQGGNCYDLAGSFISCVSLHQRTV
ncbi:tetraspanin-1-like [Pristis pectinata]|uniref:tetraspanin-1-like n=1 Tax=Pristis pectinata TaxID=685728 RepID=UPI00223D5037|nr:tetraspanin-1-like [Pristis pectinata]